MSLQPYHDLGEEQKALVDNAIRATRALIEEAMELIRNAEDGPFTMTEALRSIDRGLDRVETELSFLNGIQGDWRDLALKLRRKYDEAIRQRDALQRGQHSEE